MSSPVQPRLGASIATVAESATPDAQVIDQAAVWFARLNSGNTTATDRRAFDDWRSACAAHQNAWQRVEQIRAQMLRVPAHVAAPALLRAGSAPCNPGRRVALGGLALAAAGTGWLTWHNTPLQDMLADHHTGTGERRDLTLPDGSALSLNTATAVNMAFTAHQRTVTLRKGEILIRTTSSLGNPHRETGASIPPFVVVTAHGSITALGTRFAVRTESTGTTVTVLEKAVRVISLEGKTNTVVRAGERCLFGAGVLHDTGPAEALASSWQTGSLVVIDMPLGQLIQELARYRSGLLGCDPAVARLLVSGAFPIGDTDRALVALANAFPVRVVSNTRYWVRVVAR